MWLFTQGGFYSAVEHREFPNMVIVRCRAEEDLDHFMLALELPSSYKEFDENADYPHRCTVSKVQWVDFLALEGYGIDYDNFKDRVGMVQGHDRATRYMRVWYAMLGLGSGYGQWLFEDARKPAPQPWEAREAKPHNRKSKKNRKTPGKRGSRR